MGCCGPKTGDTESMEMGTDGKEKGKYGEPKKYDPSFNGPIKNRSCTDVICCIFFVLYLLGMVVIGGLAFQWGDPYRLLNPVDSQGNQCGNGDYADRPNLVFFDITSCISIDSATSPFTASCPTTQVCKTSCPTSNSLSISISNFTDMVCRYDVTAAEASSYSGRLGLVNDQRCAPYTLQCQAILGRCIPTVIGESISNILDANGASLTDANGQNVTATEVSAGVAAMQLLISVKNFFLTVFEDVKTAWYWILAGLGIAAVAAFIYILLMRWLAGLLVWVTIYAVLTAIGYGIYYSYQQYDTLQSGHPINITIDTYLTGLSTYTQSEQTWYYLMIILGILLAILVLLLLALRKRLQIAIALIKESSRAITNMIFTLFFPIIPWILQALVFAWFVGVGAFLVTSEPKAYEEIVNGSSTGIQCTNNQLDSLGIGAYANHTCNFIQYEAQNYLTAMQVFHLFGWFWLMNFVIALGQCVLAGSFASYYWAWDKKNDIPTFPVSASFWRTLRYHTGSLAFGSLIIAIVQLIRVALEYLDYKLTEYKKNHEWIKYVMMCLKCCFWCLEKFLKFLNKNAYIEIAIYGKNFCTAAKDAFFLLLRNILRVAVIDKVTDFIMFMGKLAITAGVAVGSFYWFRQQSDLNYYLAPVFIVTIGAYVVTTLFFSVYAMAIDTIFLCFLEDLERHDGSEEKPYYMSKKLKKILGKKNKKEEESD